MIQKLADQIDTLLNAYLNLIFSSVAPIISTTLQAVGILALVLIGINHITQFKQINYTSYLGWALKYIILLVICSSASNIIFFTDGIRSLSEGYAALVIDAVISGLPSAGGTGPFPTGTKTIFWAMDQSGNAIMQVALLFFQLATFAMAALDVGKAVFNGFLGIGVAVLGGIFIAACVVIMMIAKVGFIVAASMAPLALIMLMSEQARQYFSNWIGFIVGFAVIPLIMGCLMALILFTAKVVLDDAYAKGGAMPSIETFFPFLTIMIAALVLLFHVPTMAQTVAGSAVAVGGASVGRAMTGAMSRMSGASVVKNYMLPQRAMGATLDPRKHLHAAGAAIGAIKAGGSAKDVARTAFAAFRRHTNDRKAYWNNKREMGVKGSGRINANPAYQTARANPQQSSARSAGVRPAAPAQPSSSASATAGQASGAPAFRPLTSRAPPAQAGPSAGSAPAPAARPASTAPAPGGARPAAAASAQPSSSTSGTARPAAPARSASGRRSS